MTACHKGKGMLSVCLRAGHRNKKYMCSLDVYLTAHTGLIKGCEDVRAE